MHEFIPCAPMAPLGGYTIDMALGALPMPEYLAIVTSRRWPAPVRLTVGFMEQQSEEFKRKILLYANKWGAKADVVFSLSQTDPLIRVTTSGSQYYSYLGQDALNIPKNQHTMMLGRFSLSTPDSEWDRVVPHEFGHALGCPHEHQRRDIVKRIDPQKAYKLARQMYGWSEQMVNSQILTPLDERSLMGTPADQTSIMAYSMSGDWTYDGLPIVGGTAINDSDLSYMGSVYPKPRTPDGPVTGGTSVSIIDILKWVADFLATDQGKSLVSVVTRLIEYIVAKKPQNAAEAQAAAQEFMAAVPTCTAGNATV